MIIKFIKDQLLLAVIETIGGCDLNAGPWISGGTARRLWYNTAWIQHDVDVFFSNKQQFECANEKILAIFNEQSVVKNQFVLSPFELSISELNIEIKRHVTENAITYRIKIADTLVTIQLISNMWYSSVRNIWNNVDFSVCRFATDGATLVADPIAVDHCNSRVLTVNYTYSKPISARRVIKYSIYGFNADQHIMKQLLQQHENQNINDTVDDYV